MRDSKGKRVGHHTHICAVCGIDFDPHWERCQRCGAILAPVKKENTKSKEIK